jgi:hypothetical protein
LFPFGTGTTAGASCWGIQENPSPSKCWV